MTDTKVNTMEEDIVLLEKLGTDGDVVLARLQTLLLDAIDKVDMSSEALVSKSAIEGRVMLFKAAADMVADRQTAVIKRAAVKGRRQELESNEKFSARAVELLRMTPLRGSDVNYIPPIDPSSVDVPLLELSPEEQAGITEASMRSDSADISD